MPLCVRGSLGYPANVRNCQALAYDENIVNSAQNFRARTSRTSTPGVSTCRAVRHARAAGGVYPHAQGAAANPASAPVTHPVDRFRCCPRSVSCQPCLPVAIIGGRRRIGIEVKRTTAAVITPCMRSALDDLKLTELHVVHAGGTRRHESDFEHAIHIQVVVR